MIKVSVVGLSAIAAFWLGCGGTSTGAGTHAGPDDAGPVLAVQGHVHAPDGTGLAGADVCVLGAPGSSAGPCAKSDPDGSFTLSALPANELVSLTFNKDGFVPMLRTVLTEEQDLPPARGREHPGGSDPARALPGRHGGPDEGTNRLPGQER